MQNILPQTYWINSRQFVLFNSIKSHRTQSLYLLLCCLVFENIITSPSIRTLWVFDPLIIHQRECYISNNVLYSCCLLSYWLFYTLWPLLDKMEEELVVGCENAAAIAGGRCRHFLWPLFPGELQHAHQHNLNRCRVQWEFSAGGNITTSYTRLFFCKASGELQNLLWHS